MKTMISPDHTDHDENRKMSGWTRQILTGEMSFLERLTDADWARFIAFAQKHGIAPVLYQAIKESPSGSLPEHSLQKLRKIYYSSTQRNMRLFYELGKVLEALHEADISVIVLKGACLAEAAYGNIALRPMGDVDLLVKKKDMTKVVQILSRIGYSAGYDFQVDTFQPRHTHLPPLKGVNKLIIEIHWTIASVFNVAAVDEKEIEKIWARAIHTNVGGAPCLMLSTEDLLLHLCIHLSLQHIFEIGLRCFLDIRKVTEFYADAIDWKLLQERSRLWLVDRPVRLTFFLAEQWVGLNMPEQVRQNWKPERIDQSQMNVIEEKVMGENHRGMEPVLSDFIALKSLTEKMAILWKAFFPLPSLISRLYHVDANSVKNYLFYMVHWISLFNHFGAVVWKAWRGEAEINTLAKRDHALRQWLSGR